MTEYLFKPFNSWMGLLYLHPSLPVIPCEYRLQVDVFCSKCKKRWCFSQQVNHAKKKTSSLYIYIQKNHKTISSRQFCWCPLWDGENGTLWTVANDLQCLGIKRSRLASQTACHASHLVVFMFRISRSCFLLMPGKRSKYMLPNGGLMVIYYSRIRKKKLKKTHPKQTPWDWYIHPHLVDFSGKLVYRLDKYQSQGSYNTNKSKFFEYCIPLKKNGSIFTQQLACFSFFCL